MSVTSLRSVPIPLNTYPITSLLAAYGNRTVSDLFGGGEDVERAVFEKKLKDEAMMSDADVHRLTQVLLGPTTGRVSLRRLEEEISKGGAPEAKTMSRERA